MRELFSALAIGGVAYLIWKSLQPASGAIETVANKYAKPIGPGLEGATNVSKIETVDMGNGGSLHRRWPTNYNAPMGFYAK